MAKDNIKPIVATSYSYVNTGKSDNGKNQWKKMGAPSNKNTGHTSYGALKKDIYETTNKKDNVIPYYTKKLNSVTEYHGKDNKYKKVTYYNRQK